MRIKREYSKYITTLASEANASRFLSETPVTGLVMCGRSNVGKSTLINALLKNGIAHTSGTPGKTQNINVYEFFRSDSDYPYYLFDLPGFGHAKVSKAERTRWNHFLRQFFHILPASIACIHIMDARTPFQKADLDFLEFFSEYNNTYITVINKIDKLKNQKEKNILNKTLKKYENQSFNISADKKTNLESLENHLIDFLISNEHNQT